LCFWFLLLINNLYLFSAIKVIEYKNFTSLLYNMPEVEPPSSSLVWFKHKTKVKDDDESHRPRPRSCHTLTVVGTNGFLFGGLTDYSQDDLDEVNFAKPSNELFRIDLTNKMGLEWSKVPIQYGSDQPLPRWRHSATLFDNTQILVFGGYQSTDHRLNDLWVFDAVGYTWSQPNAKHNAEASIACQLTNNEWPNVPPPRAGHSATLIGDLLYVFGGYGGLGYSRRDLDDLYTLNVYTWVWNKVNPKGTGPEKRAGHCACGIEKKIYIFGGSNSSTQFQDLFILDTENDVPLWTKLNTMMSSPTWSLSSCSVIAIPTWKIFTFGGVTGVLSDNDRMGKFVNSTSILDTGEQ
jgi:dynein heavy chain